MPNEIPKLNVHEEHVLAKYDRTGMGPEDPEHPDHEPNRPDRLIHTIKMTYLNGEKTSHEVIPGPLAHLAEENTDAAN